MDKIPIVKARLARYLLENEINRKRLLRISKVTYDYYDKRKVSYD